MWMLTGQLADKPTCGQSCHGLINSWTSQLADSEVLKSCGKLLNFYATSNNNPNLFDYLVGAYFFGPPCIARELGAFSALHLALP